MVKKSRIRRRARTVFKGSKTKTRSISKNLQKSFVIEFQCAKISPETFIKRTRTYQDSGYYPFWILGGNQLKRQFHNAYRLSSFQWLFSTNLTSVLKQSPQIISFCPQNKTFIFLKNIKAISATLSLTTPTILSINQCSFEDFYQPYKEHLQIDTWLHTKRLWRTPRPHLSHSQHFLRKLYLKRGQPLWLFPSEAGVPICCHYFIETPTYIWQSWLLEIFVTNKKEGEKFHITLVKRAFKTLVNKGVFKLRILPLFDSMSFYLAIEHYLKFLCHIQVLTTMDYEVFIKNQEVSHQKTLEQAYTKDQQVIRHYIEFNY
ncbi:hypothetical protein H1D32_23440 [Anaerobacillus sp. CMMVII]|nr:hypothetical protein [Anaerobacillus sp. CMMVII]